jgi:HTH-type transcriptional regulator/antitoxin HipB
MITHMGSDETTSRRIGRTVREARRRQGIDQAKLALIANVAVRSIHRVENGGPTVRLDVLVRILSALGLELEVRRRSGG